VNAALWVTAVRISIIPVVMALVLVNTYETRWWATGLYAVAAATDSVDGWLARSRGQVTVAGAFLDPLADKLLVSAAMVCLVQLGAVGAWAAMIIITREFAVTGLRLVAVNEHLVIPAGRLGKAKTLSQNLAVLAFIAPHAGQWLNAPLLYLALILTVLSGAYYFIMARRRLFEMRAPDAHAGLDP
jgi:CDP-diacylglycerol---glycerol-3-phosphate 3-phosphatidyltransferase